MKFIKQVLADFSSDRCTTLAAALAYYTAFALPPLLYLLLLLVTFCMTIFYDSSDAKQRAEEVLMANASQMLGNQDATDEIESILKSAQQTDGKWWKALMSLAGILVGATGVVSALQDALNQVWQVQIDPAKAGIKQMICKRVLSFTMILGLGFLLVVSLGISSVLTALGDRLGQWIGVSAGIAEATNFGVQLAVIFVIFAALFRFMPDAVVQWRDVLVGAFITTVLFLMGRYGMQLYFSFSSPGAQMGSAAASLVVLLVWVYYSSVIVLLGAEATQVWAARFGEEIKPEPNAVRVVQTFQK